jgi:aminocarboxymuconate-semialdehyde decarboxylase
VIVDVHAHHVPEAFLRRLDGGRWRIMAEPAGEAGWRISADGRPVRQPLRAALLDLGRRIDDMDAAGIDVRVLSGWASLAGYEVPDAAAADYARASNEALAAAAATAPGRLVALATVPLQAPAAAAYVLEHAMAELGMPGAQILTRVGEAELDDPALEPFWERAEALGAFLLVHPADSLAGRALTRHRLDNLVGNPAETTLAIAHLVLGGVVERHPGLRICAVHAGGYLPFAAGRLDRGHRATPELVGAGLTRAPSEYLRSLY